MMSSVEKTRVGTERNLLDVLDKVHDISADHVDTTHVFTLSQVYEGLLLKMGAHAQGAARHHRSEGPGSLRGSGGTTQAHNANLGPR